jgi:hypothetical protein
MTIGHCEVEQTSRINLFFLNNSFGNNRNKIVYVLNRPQHCRTEDIWAEPSFWGYTWIVPHTLKTIEEERKCPLAICTAVDSKIPLIGETLPKAAFDMLPTSQIAIMHPHKTTMVEGVTIIIAQRAFGSGSHMSEDQRRGGLGSDSLEIDAIPSWSG